MQAQTILMDIGMSSRPSYYSGRGATLSDLNSDKLLKIQQLILKNHGEDAAKAMVDMVVSMEEMNATDFINNLYTLESNGWKWNKDNAEKNGIDIDKDENGNHNLVSAFATIGAVMSRRYDETREIRGEFLMQNGIMPSRGRWNPYE